MSSFISQFRNFFSHLDGILIWPHSRGCLQSFYQEFRGLREETTLVGVRVTGLVPKEETSRPMLPEQARKERLSQALDRIRDRWGEGAIWRGSTYVSKLLVEATGGMGRQKEIALEFKGKS